MRLVIWLSSMSKPEISKSGEVLKAVKSLGRAMPSNKQVTGMRGIYLVAAELSKHSFIASPTSRSARAADILATDAECKRAFSVQVKTKSTRASYWLLHRDDKRFVSDSHIYVFVSIKEDGVPTEFFIIP